MSMQKTYSTEFEFYSELPSMPGPGQVASIQKEAQRSLGVLVNSGWAFRSPHVESTEQTGRYRLKLGLVRRGQRRFAVESAQIKAEQIREKLLMRLPGWKSSNADVSLNGEDDSKRELTPAELLMFPDNIEGYFSHIYNRDVQIKEILDSIALARDTNMRIRNHVLMYGPPGAGKTEIGLAISNIFGDIAVRRLDSTSLTKAGAERLLLEADIIPPIIILEEVEKTNECNLPWLLAVLDTRGELIKTTSRMNVSRLTKCLVIATANDINKFRSYHDGALADRFGLPLYCNMPDRDLLTKILERELEILPHAKREWIEPAIAYALEVEKTYQIRRIKAIMSIGRDRLLDGSFQREHDILRRTKEQDEKTITEYHLSSGSV